VKNFYIADKATWDSFPKEHFRYSHWIPTDEPGKILVVAEFHNDTTQDFWEATPSVEPLPHLVFGNTPVAPAHVHLLKAVLKAVPSDRTFDIATKAARQHPAFRPERF